MMPFRRFLVRFFLGRRFRRELLAMTEPKINLLEARLRAAECWKPQYEKLFEPLRWHARLQAERARLEAQAAERNAQLKEMKERGIQA